MPLFNPGITGPQGATGVAGPQGNPGVTGAQGPGISGIYVLNNGVTLGLFNSINFHGAGVTGVAAGIVADIYIAGGVATGTTADQTFVITYLHMGA